MTCELDALIPYPPSPHQVTEVDSSPHQTTMVDSDDATAPCTPTLPDLDHEAGTVTLEAAPTLLYDEEPFYLVAPKLGGAVDPNLVDPNLLAPATLPYDEEPVYLPPCAGPANSNPVPTAWSDSESEVVHCNTQLFEESQLLSQERPQAPEEHPATSERDRRAAKQHIRETIQQQHEASVKHHGSPAWVLGQRRAWNRVEARTKTDILMAQRTWRRNRLLGVETKTVEAQQAWVEMVTDELHMRKRMWHDDIARAHTYWEINQKQDPAFDPTLFKDSYSCH